MNNKLAVSISALLLFSSWDNLFSFEESRIESSIETGQYLSQPNTESPRLHTAEADNPSLVNIEAISDEFGGATLIFHFPESVEFKYDVEDDNMYLEFNQSIDSKDLITVQDKVSSLIKRFANGYNTLYLVAKRPVYYLVASDDLTFYLNIIPNEEATQEMTRTAKIAFARLLVEKRAYRPAIETLSNLLEEYPDDKDVLVLYSSLEGLLPRWQNQVSILTSLNIMYPFDEDIEKLMFDAYTPHSSYCKAERQMQRTVGLAAVQVYLLQNETIVKTNPNSILYLGEQYQLWSGHVAGIVNSEGNTVGFRGWRNRGAFYMRNEWDSGTTLKASLYDQKCAFGAGLEHSMLLPYFQGRISTELQWHRPSWEVFEGLAYHGREDRVYSIMESVYNRFFTWSLGGGARRVGITGTPNGFCSALANVGAYINLMIPNPIFGISYNLDAEYILYQKSKIGADGTSYNPVPYTSFENHTIRGFVSYIYRDRWYFSTYGGKTMNRIGMSDYTYGFELKYIKPFPCYGWEAKISYDHFPSTVVQGAVAEFLTFNIIFRY